MKKIITLLLIAITTSCFSQIEERKGKLFFKVGSEYRITPFRYNTGNVDSNIPTNIDTQNSGVAFHYGLDYFITKNLSIGFNNSFRYDLLINTINEIDQDFGSQKADKTLIVGGHLYLDYHVKVFKNSELFARFGKSLLNGGTEYTRKRTYFDSQGETIAYSYENDNFMFFATNIAIGYKKGKVELLAGMYTSSITNYFVATESLKIPYLNFTYTLGKLW